MKICYLSDASSIHTKKFCDFFKRKGYEIHVISLNYGEIDGVKVHTFNVSKDKMRYGSSVAKLQYLKHFFEIKKLVKEINPDILHAHYATSYGLLGRLCNFHPYIISVWGSDVYDFPKGSSLKRKLLMSNLRKADVIMSTSKVMAEETKLYTEKNIEITPFGVDIDFFKPKDNRYNKNDQLVIGTVKTLEPKYGIEFLVRAFGQVLKKYHNIKLEIAGDGSQKEYLMELCKTMKIERNVHFLGFINRDEVIEAFNRFDITVFPSTLDSESFGVAAVEAQACGSATIISNVGGLPEATNPGITSLLVEKENEKQLADALEKLIVDEKLRVEMGIQGRKFVEQNYNIQNNFSKVEEIYHKVRK